MKSKTTRKGDPDQLERKLDTDKGSTLPTGQTFVERRGGRPSHVLHGRGDNSFRKRRKAKVEVQVESRAKRRIGSGADHSS
jgi:hypothetical protein